MSASNQQIAYFIARQTYDERLAMAKWIVDALNFFDMESSTQEHALAACFSSWAKCELAEEAEETPRNIEAAK